MLSTEDPPESSSSPNKAQSYLKTVDDSQKHSFSIRDYVFSSRSKDITSNWPFPQQSLLLCLKNGIKDILPPFDPPDLIRSQFFAKKVEQISSQAAGPPDKEPDSLNCNSSLSPSRDKAKPAFNLDLLDAETQTYSRVTIPDYSAKRSSQIEPPSVHVINTSEASPDIAVAKPPIRHEKPTKTKCPLIVRLSTIPENRIEDLSSISTVSDPMASNVCPVCKTFSSSSNTTLNAHIDQCLSEESNAKRISVAKLKVKPRKKRLMVDIYTTAPVCTLEDLDRRNGTKWAAELGSLNASVAPESDLVAQAIMESQDGNNVAKRPKFSPEDENETRDDGDEAAVYVDSNGIKLRILSKFGNHPAASEKNFKLKKHSKNIKTCKHPMLGKKKHFVQNYSNQMKMKHIKLKQQSKKSAMLKLSRRQVQDALGGELQSGGRHAKEEFVSTFTDPDAQVRVCTSLTRWVCSKRSVLKKRKNKVNEMPRENLLRRTKSTLIENKTRSTLVENNQVDSENIPVLRSHTLKLSRSPGDLTASPKTKKKDVFSSTDSYVGSKASSSWRSESSSANRFLLKLSRSTDNVISSPKSKKEEMLGKTASRLSAISQPLEEERNTIMEKNVIAGGPSLPAKTNNAIEKEINNINANMWKHRSKKGGLELLKYDAQRSLNVSRSSRRLRPCNSDEPEVPNIAEVELEREDELPELIVSHDRETEEAMELAVSINNIVDNQISEKNELCGGEVQTEADTENSLDQQELQGLSSGDNEFRRNEDYCLVEEDEIHRGIVSGEASIMSSLSHGDAENPQENSSVTSNGPIESQECNLTAHTCSPVSTAAISSPAYPNDHELYHRPMVFPRDPCSNISTVDTLAMQPPRSMDQLVNIHPCCCSRREAIHRDFHFFQPDEPNVTPVRPGSSSTLSSHTRADMISTTISSLDLHSDPTTTNIPSNLSYKYPSFIDFTSPSPSPRTQTLLRLMGKNLMVDKEQSVQPPYLFVEPMQSGHISPLGFPSSLSVQPEENFLYNQYSVPEHHVLERSLSESLYNGSVNQPHWRTDLKFSRTPKEIIMIDGSPEHEEGPPSSTIISPSTSATINHNNSSNISLQRSFSCFPLPSQYLARDFLSHNSQTTAASISCSTMNSTSMKGGTTSEAPPPILPRPFLFPTSPAHVTPHLFYSQTLR